MKKIIIVSFLAIMITQVYGQNKSQQKINAKVANKIAQIESIVDSLSQENDRLKKDVLRNSLAQDRFNFILDNVAEDYQLIISIVVGLIGLISFGFFSFKSQQIVKALKLFHSQDVKINDLIESVKKDKIEVYYYYANICDLYSLLADQKDYREYQQSYFYAMRSIKYLLLANKTDGIKKKLQNASSYLTKAIIDKSYDWKLKENNIIEIRETFLELSKNHKEKYGDLLVNNIKKFEENIENLK